MENKVKSDADRWVEERMALLTVPDEWEPNEKTGRKYLRGRVLPRRAVRAKATTDLSLAMRAISNCLLVVFAGAALLIVKFIERLRLIEESERLPEERLSKRYLLSKKYLSKELDHLPEELDK
ncbi:MAG TPA: hypothetical protein VJ302_31130 [Blastocatellia bacterium]|nr:hypothetical protein [Blastocatellia bacterium]